MQIIVNTDNHITNSADFTDEVSVKVSEGLANFSQHVTRTEVYLSDENSSKGGPADKKCVLESRIEKRKPVTVTEHGPTLALALHGAIQKMERVLASVHDKHAHPKRRSDNVLNLFPTLDDVENEGRGTDNRG